MSATDPLAHLVGEDEIKRFGVLGPVVEILTPLDTGDGAPCAIRGTIPPGGVVPLHSHPEPETFIALSGEVEGLSLSAADAEWVRFGEGDVFHVPGGAPHAWRNPAGKPASSLIVTEARIGRFFTEVGGRSAGDATPSEEQLARFLAVAERYGYWNATPEENAAVGISLPAGRV